MNNVIAFDRKKKTSDKKDSTAYGFKLEYLDDSVCIVLDRSNCEIRYFEDSLERVISIPDISDFRYKDVVTVMANGIGIGTQYSRFIFISLTNDDEESSLHIFVMLDMDSGLSRLVTIPKVQDYRITSMELLGEFREGDQIAGIEIITTMESDEKNVEYINDSLISVNTIIMLLTKAELFSS